MDFDNSRNTCEYCDMQISESDQEEHLEECEVYGSYIKNYHRSSIRARLYSAIRDSQRLSLEGEKLKNPKKGLKFRRAHCPMCSQVYSDLLLPLVLPGCGHTVCSQCTNKIHRCPVCRCATYRDVLKFPINYALLEISNQEICETHGLKIMAYCEDDDSLLCGVCTFEHKDHRSYVLTDPRTHIVSQEKLNQIEIVQEKLQTHKNSYLDHIEELNQHIDKLRCFVDKHTHEFHTAEARMLSKIQKGTSACVQQVRDALDRNKLNEILIGMKTKIRVIDSDLREIRNKKDEFDHLSMIEKLTNLDTFDEQPPERKEANLGIPESVDYQKAIKSAKIPKVN